MQAIKQSQYRPNFKTETALLEKNTRKKKQRQLIEELVQVNHRYCIGGCLISFLLCYAFLILFSYTGLQFNLLFSEIEILDKQIGYLASNITADNNRSEVFKHRISKKIRGRVFSSNCTEVTGSTNVLDYSLNVDQMFENKLQVISQVHYATLQSYILQHYYPMSSTDTSNSTFNYDLSYRQNKENKWFVDFKCEGQVIVNKFKVCVMVSGQPKAPK